MSVISKIICKKLDVPGAGFRNMALTDLVTHRNTYQ